jgi:hypothetical protein
MLSVCLHMFTCALLLCSFILVSEPVAQCGLLLLYFKYSAIHQYNGVVLCHCLKFGNSIYRQEMACSWQIILK